MCLILFAVNPNPEYRLIVAANRDEFYSRKASPAELWRDKPGILAGRDQEKGGTWLGIREDGRFAAVTNFKEEITQTLPKRSRGELPTNFLLGNEDPVTYSEAVSKKAEKYRGFNLLTANNKSVAYYSNRLDKPVVLKSGYYGLSNQALNCNWPKVAEGRKLLRDNVQINEKKLPAKLFEILMHKGDGREFSDSFITGKEYGTRAATVVIIKNSGGILFEERTFGPGGAPLANDSFVISYNGDS